MTTTSVKYSFFYFYNIVLRLFFFSFPRKKGEKGEVAREGGEVARRRTRTAAGMKELGDSGAEGRLEIGVGSNTQVHHHFTVKSFVEPRQL